MQPWLPFPIHGWPELAEMLEARGTPWPEWAAVTFLRWTVDQFGVGSIPGRPALCAMFRWTDWSVRQFLANTDVWWDPDKGEAPGERFKLPTRGPKKGAPARTSLHQFAPAEEQANAENRDESASFHQDAPDPLHTRGDPPSHSPSPESPLPPSTGGVSSSSPATTDDLVDAAADYLEAASAERALAGKNEATAIRLKAWLKRRDRLPPGTSRKALHRALATAASLPPKPRKQAEVPDTAMPSAWLLSQLTDTQAHDLTLQLPDDIDDPADWLNHRSAQLLGVPCPCPTCCSTS